jgi:hypothetical protein
MPMLDPHRFQALLDAGKLKPLFVEELGWENPVLAPQHIEVDGESFTLTQVAHKRGVAVFLCSADREGKIPLRATLLKIEKKAEKIAHEHLLIFADAHESVFTWLWVARVPGEPARPRTHTWHKGSSAEILRQKLGQIIWSLDQEDAITLTDVITGLKRAFDRERISRTFYDQFKRQHDNFAGFIKGLSEISERDWYASLMLNRMMFIYFIQKKGFLDGDENYLVNRLAIVQANAGKGKFHSFYRLFLRRLFHEGLGQPKERHSPGLVQLIGDIPYLNGGLFSLHELEERRPDIDVPDEAFAALFEFFDQWDWHLDTRPLRNNNEINPDVLGYIFEKYINQKQMGAYYTKEDITGYISKNTVIPHLLETACARCKVAFDGEASVWNLLKTNPDKYIYSAMKTGVLDAGGSLVPEAALPDFVQTGMKDAKARMFERRYNLGEAVFQTATGERGTLPTETWREYVDRRNRCLAVYAKLAAGEVKSVDALVTLNLDIRQFMQDVIVECRGPDLLRAVWQAIVGRVPEKSDEKFRHGITILDPTCGSGAFLFAALNILEPLYEACLDRMADFCEDAQKLGKKPEADFEKTLAEADNHPSRSYYVYKSIILHNLFGVDIMPDAVEICKLRLFLKLVSQVDRAEDLEPLPDIDFNIRTGNTLVGYATEAHFDKSLPLMGVDSRQAIKADMADLADLFDRFRQQQTVHGGAVTAEDKRVLRDKLSALSMKLDKYLAADYRIDHKTNKEGFADWRASHQPFHWFAEFYAVMRKGGFDVVIGNPPYIQNNSIKNVYPQEFITSSCGNIYALTIERCLSIINVKGKQGVIVPVSSISTEGYETLQNLLVRHGIIISSYDDRPAHLFDGLDKNTLSIIISGVNKNKKVYSSKLCRWNTNERSSLFSQLNYMEINIGTIQGCIPKIGNSYSKKIWDKIFSNHYRLVNFYTQHIDYITYYSRKVNSFLQSVDFIPEVRDGEGNLRSPSEFKKLSFSTENESHAVFLLLNSSLFRWFLDTVSDASHLNKREIDNFPFNPKLFSTYFNGIAELSKSLSDNLKTNSFFRTMHYRHDTLIIQCIMPKQSKKLIDSFDLILGKHMGFTDEETDFIINYDIKYRMGGVDDEE